MANVAFLGLGAMGSRMAARLLAAGHQLTVYNRNAAAAEPLLGLGAHWAPTPRAAAESASCVVSMLRDDAASGAVWLTSGTGAVHGLRPHSVVVECGTVTPNWIATLSAAIAAQGSQVVDAPVMGSRPQAEAGQLISLVGGDAVALDAVRTILESWSASIHHIGSSGQGARLKLAANSLFAIQVVAWAEWLAALQQQGLKSETAVEVLGNLPIASPAAKIAASMMQAGRFAPLFPVDLVEKDLRYAAAQRDNSLDLPLTHSARAVFERAQRAGLGSEHLNAVVKLF